MQRLLIALLVALVGCAKAPSDITTLKLSLILGESSDWYRGAAKWKELVERRSGGKIRVRIIPEASLTNHNQRAELEAVISGALDASLESSILLTIIEPKFTVFSMPWLFDNHDEAERICDGALGRKMLALLPPKGLVGLAYGVNGFRQITNNRRPIGRLEDLKNLKIRVPAIKMYISIFRLLGADPSEMNFGDLFPALRQGIMHAQENPLSVIYSKKLYEVQKYLTVWNYSYDPIILCMNKRRWESFPPEQQKMLRQAALEAMNYERQLVRKSDEVLIGRLKEAGMEITYLEPAELKRFQQAVQPIYRQYENVIGKELLREFVEATSDEPTPKSP